LVLIELNLSHCIRILSARLSHQQSTALQSLCL
jgi:hypothetical protein